MNTIEWKSVNRLLIGFLALPVPVPFEAIYFDCNARDIQYGRQTRTRDGGNLNSTVFVLPSTSGSAKKFWDLKHWRTVAEEFKAGATLRCG